ncbi:MAG: sulfatase-like hydrolase/transferase [Nitrospirae bacterium]|nr:sulfatase-like hydrolase/transferase [Nitrospirota bacterium]
MKTSVSYWKLFRIIFVIFSLILMGDVFFRWDGFRFYASFSEFLPSIALITILWGVIASFTAFFIWVCLRVLEWFFLRAKWKINTEYLLFFISVLGLLLVIIWTAKLLLFQQKTTLQLKMAVLFCTVLISIFLTRLSRNKLSAVHELITPLVLLFGIWLVLSFPLVIYHTWLKEKHNVISKEMRPDSNIYKKQPNIILVTFDALTARNMSVYGYYKETTPFISEWAKTAALFKKTEAESNHTTSTTASLMTGKRLWTHQTYHVDGSQPLRSTTENLPRLLKNRGYFNMAFIQNTNASVELFGMSESFDAAPLPTEFEKPASLYEFINKFLYQTFGNKIRLHDWLVKKDFILYKLLMTISRDYSKTTAPPEDVFKRLLSTLDSEQPETFFAWLHILPPHDPYLPPAPYMGMFDPSHKFRTQKTQTEFFLKKGALKKQPDIETIRSRYDEFIRYCDEQFKGFIRELAIRNKLENTVIILSADHGEGFDPDDFGHFNEHLYEHVTHIPLIIKEPGQNRERIINDVVEQIDIPATILDMANLPAPSWMEGRSLMPLMRGKTLPQIPHFSMALHSNRIRQEINKGTIAVWEGDHKLIYYFKDGKSLLFNLKKDPFEQTNLSEKEPVLKQRLLSLIRDNLQNANEKIKEKNKQ